MKTETIFDLASLGLRAAEAALRRRRPPASPGPDTRADRLVRRALPMAEKALARVVPLNKPVTPSGKRKAARRRSRAGFAVVMGAAAAGAAAYIVVKEQQRVRARYAPLRAPFRPELLDVLAPPGGGGRLAQTSDCLTDRHSGAVYAIIDGIPDFIAPSGAAGDLLASEDSWLQDLVRPLALQAMGRNRAGDAALAAAISGAAADGWALSVPSGRGTYEIEMARANPRAHILCLSNKWDVLLEARRRATEAGLANLYFVRGIPRLLPVRDSVIGGVWSGTGLHRYPRAERELTQMVRVAKPGAPVAGTSLVRGGPAIYDLALSLAAPYLPGLNNLDNNSTLLEAVGLKEARLFRDGAFVRFMAVRA
jgi:SAM-dependent methyltransferase